jgi:cytochrome P450
VIDILTFLARPEAIDDPYGVFDELRARGRVLWIEELNRWLVTGHPEAVTVLRNEKGSNDRRNWDDYRLPEGLDRPPGGISAADPPAHTRLRALVQQAFTPRLIQLLQPRIEKLAHELMTESAERGEFDLMVDLGYPLPAIVLAELLGIPAGDHVNYRVWSTTFIDTFDPVSHAMISQEGVEARDSLAAYLTAVIEERRRSPREDLISGLVQAEQDGERLSGEETLEMCLLLTVAGMETTANLIGNGMNTLFRHPDEARRLRAEPGLIDSAVEELMRYDAPIQVSGRAVLDDFEVGGAVLRKGQMAGVLVGAANRDPQVFADPHRLDLARRPNNHLGFGRGIHFCLGAPLARLEGAITINALLERFPGLHPVGTPTRRNNVHVRGFASLPVAVD